jgi:thiamine biosynthesis lipoprotein
VALERPPQDGGAGMVVALHGLSVATSGDYRRYVDHQGQRYTPSIRVVVHRYGRRWPR